MNDRDFNAFSEAWNAAYELCSRGRTCSAGATNLAFEALSIYALEQITGALSQHCRSASAKYGLVPADVVALIDGEKPNTDQIIAAAMKPKTALAVLCRIEIGSWNLDNWDRHQLKPLAESCIAQIPEWKQRIEAGELLDHEQMAMLRYGVNPKAGQLAGPIKQLENSK